MVDGAAGGDDADDGGGVDGGVDCGDAEEGGADDPADAAGELAAGAAAAEDPEWCRLTRMTAPTPEAASTATTTMAEIQISVRDLLGGG